MGDFILYDKNKISENKLCKVFSTLDQQGSSHPVTFNYKNYNVCFFPKSISPHTNYITCASGEFCGSSGTLYYKGLFGEEALRKLLEVFSPEEYKPEDFSGTFTVILQRDGKLFLLTDPIGTSRVFNNQVESLWSSSFLAVASSLDKITPCKQGIYEYVFQQTTYGTETVVSEVNILDGLKIYQFKTEGISCLPKPLSLNFLPSEKPYQDILESTVDLLRTEFSYIKKTFDNKIRTALSGGYDSRLILALLIDAGVIPNIFVYGAEDSLDVLVAKEIAAGEGLDIDHMDKSFITLPKPEEYKKIVTENFFAMDGFPLEGIFDFGSNLSSRKDRAKNNFMVINGGGGEILRNFFYLPNRQYKVPDIVDSFYSRFTLSQCTQAFDVREYRDNLKKKIMDALSLDREEITRTEVEYIYPAFRLRNWTSKDNNNNTRMGSFITPYISYNVIREALNIPLHYKNHGHFQADLINHISPELAKYPSDYGYAFNAKVAFKYRVKNHLNYCRPTLLRRYSYAVQHYFKSPAPLPKIINEEYLEGIIDNKMPYMGEFFNISAIKDHALLKRIYTLEFLFNYIMA